MRVLLVYPRADRDISDWADHGALAEPLALEYIAAATRLEGHEARIIDLRMHFDELDQTLLDYQPDVVGVTGYSMHVLRCLEICRKAKDLVPTCKTVVGGHHATLEPIDFFEPEVDYVVKGEGTLPFRQILAQVAGRESESLIPAVCSRVNGVFGDGGPGRAFDLNDIPLPDRSLALQDRAEYNLDWMKPLALARTSVGCPYRCSFCALWRIMDGRYYTREVERVAHEISTINEPFVLLTDDEAFVNEKRMKELAEELIRKKVEKKYFAYCRLDTLTRERDLMKLWKDAGIDRLLIGIETIFDWELKEYNKRQTRDSILRGLEAANELGIRLLSNFVVSPNYTDREFDGLIQFVRENDLEYPGFTVWTPIPATVDYSQIEITEKQPNGRPNWDYFDLNHAVTPTKMPKEHFERRYEDLYWIFASKFAAAKGNNKKVPSARDTQRYQAALARAYAELAAKVLSAGRTT
ncbi:MAG: radical SAM protein [Deltaproteobacteria bacterium]|nr:radical SAM protein [Deltaproteobacteria bacterium]